MKSNINKPRFGVKKQFQTPKKDDIRQGEEEPTKEENMNGEFTVLVITM